MVGADYENVLIPAIEEKLKKFNKIRLLYYLGQDFESYDFAAMWDDTKVGFAHLSAWEKIAIVTDVHWVQTGVKVIGFAIPGEVKLFANSQLESAKEWLSN